MKDARDYLEHILDCIAAVERYTAAGRASLDDARTLDAVIRRLQVMAESSLRLPETHQRAHPNVGWRHIRNFRNRLVHEYLDVDVEIVWGIVQRNLPPLKAAAQALLDSLPAEEERDGE